MPDSDPAHTDRVVFLDNLRYAFVLCVVMEHACNAYRGLAWWPVADPAISLPVQMLSGFFDVFSMPLLFYVAGYFALPSIRKKNIGAFLADKLERLGIPWLVCVLTVVPAMALIYHATRQGLAGAQRFWGMWREVMASALSFDVGIVPSMDRLMAVNGFYQRYMWFLSLLIAMFFIFAALYALKPNWFAPTGSRPIAVRQGAWPTLRLFLAVALTTTLLSMATVGLIQLFGPPGAGPEPLFTLGNVIQFRPSRLFFYLIYFGLGVLTYRNNWIGRGRFPGRPGAWLVLFPVLLVAFLAVCYLMLRGPRGMAAAVGFAYFLLVNFLCMATLGLFMSLAHRWWNRPRALDRDLASNSYNIYIAHYVFVIGLQAALLQVPGLSGLAKFAITSLLGGALAYTASRLLIKPHPRLAAAAAFGLLIVMFLVF